jgi:hypothetical protein
MREVLSGLGVDDYFINNGLPAILKLLKEICETPADIVSIRGARYGKLKTAGRGTEGTITK